MAATETVETLTQNYVKVPACTHLKVQIKMLLKLINNSSRLKNGNHDRDGVWISDLN